MKTQAIVALLFSFYLATALAQQANEPKPEPVVAGSVFEGFKSKKPGDVRVTVEGVLAHSGIYHVDGAASVWDVLMSVGEMKYSRWHAYAIEVSIRSESGEDVAKRVVFFSGPNSALELSSVRIVRGMRLSIWAFFD